MTNIANYIRRAHHAIQVVTYWATLGARSMVGVPDYQTYVDRRRAAHPRERIMTYKEFFRERQNVRYTISKGRFKGCC